MNKIKHNFINYIKSKYKLLIGEKTAERIKIEIGTVKNGNKKEKIAFFT